MERSSPENYVHQIHRLDLFVLELVLKRVANPEHERNGSGIKSRPQICTKSLKMNTTSDPAMSPLGIYPSKTAE